MTWDWRLALIRFLDRWDCRLHRWAQALERWEADVWWVSRAALVYYVVLMTGFVALALCGII